MSHGRSHLALSVPGFCEPAYSPDGSAIVFRRGKELFTMDADGGGAKQLSDAPAGGANIHPSWGR